MDHVFVKDRNSAASGRPVNAALLLVNDDTDELFFLRKAIRGVLPAVDLIEANSADAALDLFSRGGVTAIVTDNRMPLMDGIELVRLIRRRDPDIPIIMVSGLSNIESSAREAGVNAFIPVDRLPEAAVEIARLVNACQLHGQGPPA